MLLRAWVYVICWGRMLPASPSIKSHSPCAMRGWHIWRRHRNFSRGSSNFAEASQKTHFNISQAPPSERRQSEGAAKLQRSFSDLFLPPSTPRF